jgi:hypothetical protein
MWGTYFAAAIVSDIIPYRPNPLQTIFSSIFIMPVGGSCYFWENPGILWLMKKDGPVIACVGCGARVEDIECPNLRCLVLLLTPAFLDDGVPPSSPYRERSRVIAVSNSKQF